MNWDLKLHLIGYIVTSIVLGIGLAYIVTFGFQGEYDPNILNEFLATIPYFLFFGFMLGVVVYPCMYVGGSAMVS